LHPGHHVHARITEREGKLEARCLTGHKIAEIVDARTIGVFCRRCKYVVLITPDQVERPVAERRR